ncbi:MAG: hypothetical protein ABIB79_05085 [archaeon]
MPKEDLPRGGLNSEKIIKIPRDYREGYVKRIGDESRVTGCGIDMLTSERIVCPVLKNIEELSRFTGCGIDLLTSERVVCPAIDYIQKISQITDVLKEKRISVIGGYDKIIKHMVKPFKGRSSI